MKKNKLAIIDDHNLFRKGLIKLINLGDQEHKYSILFEAENGNDLKEKMDKCALPDIDSTISIINTYSSFGIFLTHS